MSTMKIVKMRLKQIPDGETHLSHFHHLVSAYETSPETVQWFEDYLVQAVDTAKSTGESQVVDQDSMDHIFVVHPSGTISLYRQVGRYEVVIK